MNVDISSLYNRAPTQILLYTYMLLHQYYRRCIASAVVLGSSRYKSG
jgi:hypothetical protein